MYKIFIAVILLVSLAAFASKQHVPLRCMTQFDITKAKNCHDISSSEMSCDNIIIKYNCISANPYEIGPSKLVCKPANIE